VAYVCPLVGEIKMQLYGFLGALLFLLSVRVCLEGKPK
jgi:hypothetical protein